MTKGIRIGGRQKGTPNKRTVEVAERLEALCCNPIEGMARIAMDAKTPVDLQGKMFAELAGYLYPKRRAVEHTGEDGAPIAFVNKANLASLGLSDLTRLAALLESVAPAQ